VHPQRYKVLFSIYRDVEKLYPSSGIAKFISWLSGRFWQRAIRDQKQKAGVVQMCSVKLSEKKAPIQWNKASLFDAYWMPTKESAAHRYKCDLKS
jgi:hypothetical protein